MKEIFWRKYERSEEESTEFEN